MVPSESGESEIDAPAHRTEDVPPNARFLEIALSAMPVGISWANLADQKIIYMNRKFTEIFGYTLGDFPDISSWIEHYPHPEDRDLARQRWGQYFAAPVASEFVVEPMELRIRCLDGSVKTIINSGVILPETGWALAAFVDITDRKRDELLLGAAERQSRENEAIYRFLLDHSPEMIILSPFDPSRRYVSPAVMQITGFTAEEYLALRKLEMIHPLDRDTANSVVSAIKGGDLQQLFRYRALQRDGSYRWVEAIVTGYVDPDTRQAAGYVATVRDISDQVKREETYASEYRVLAEVASLDELTGIANRRRFNQAFKSEALRHTRSTPDLSLLLLDIDRFKQFNDLYGHPAGDACLKQIAVTVASTLHRASDLAARFGGEEFVVLLPMTDAAGAETTAQNILKAIAALAIPHADSPYGVITVSIGISSWASPLPLDEALLIERADRALYQAKDSGRNACRRYQPEPPSPDPAR